MEGVTKQGELSEHPEPSTGNWGVTLVMGRKCLCPLKRSLQYTATYSEDRGGGHKEVWSVQTCEGR